MKAVSFREQPLRLRVFLLVVYLVTIGALYLSIADKYVTVQFNKEYCIGILFFSMLATLTDSFAFYYKNISFSTTFAVTIASYILFGPLAAIIIVIIGHSCRVLKANGVYKHFFNTPLYGKIFNYCTLTLSILAGNFTYIYTGGSVGHKGLILNGHFMNIEKNLPFITMFCLVDFFVDTFIISFLSSIMQKKNVLYVFLKNVRLALLNIVALLPFGLIVAITFEQFRYLGVLLVIAPIILARYTFSLYIQAKSQYVQTVDTLMHAMEARDKYTEGHSQRVAQLATAIAKELKYNEWKVENLNMAALLHDVGKIGIDDNILNKPGKLTNEEFQAIKNHPEIGYNILKDIKNLEGILPIVRHHHERYDGKGYPAGKSAEELDLDIFIIQLADSIDAMVTDRPYRKSLTQEEVIDEIEKNAGTQFHPKVVEAYFNMLKKQKKVV